VQNTSGFARREIPFSKYCLLATFAQNCQVVQASLTQDEWLYFQLPFWKE